MQGILLDQGIPSVQRRTRGFDVPDFLAAGPRDILVPEAAAQDAAGAAHRCRLGPQLPQPGSDAGPGAAPGWPGDGVALVSRRAFVWVLLELAARSSGSSGGVEHLVAGRGSAGSPRAGSGATRPRSQPTWSVEGQLEVAAGAAAVKA